ncbi:MAG: HTH domain-containing protein [Propionibacteriaceae bacterium]|jgi:transcriptional antiterminator/mannitol/fructose-specific phosphotransferase system IIA component|nr:HTH domain-containing protein [Propionibacteriaceae bacterium]
MDRGFGILTHIETSLSATPTQLAERFGVSPKTIAADIERLNAALSPNARVELAGDIYRLLVVDAGRFMDAREGLAARQGTFSDPSYRLAHILARLGRSDTPVAASELALEMSVGRTTVLSDISKLRELLGGYRVQVLGRTNSGFELAGPERGIRLAILDNALPGAYHSGDDWVGEAVQRAIGTRHLPVDLIETVKQWARVVVNRRELGHELEEVGAELDCDAAASMARDVAEQLVLSGRAGESQTESFSQAEILFLALPLAGRRTPLTLDELGALDSPDFAAELLGRVFERIRTEMGISISPEQLLGEFATHLAFMMNRMRYSLRVDAQTVPPQMRNAYPVAWQMAVIARDQILEETSLAMDESELALASTYFQIFLDEHTTRGRQHFRVAIVTSRGPAAARLIHSQLTRVLPPDTRYSITSENNVGDLGEFDLIVKTPGVKLASAVPTLELAEVFDLRELEHLLTRIPFRRPLRLHHRQGSMLLSLLDADRVVRLAPETPYLDQVTTLGNHLHRMGMVDREFLDGLLAREREATTRFSDLIGFPHAIVSAPAPVAALGLIPRSDKEPGLRAVLLLGVPDDDTLLIEAYDEVIRLAADRDLLNRISRLASYEQLFYLLNSREGK